MKTVTIKEIADMLSTHSMIAGKPNTFKGGLLRTLIPHLVEKFNLSGFVLHQDSEPTCAKYEDRDNVLMAYDDELMRTIPGFKGDVTIATTNAYRPMRLDPENKTDIDLRTHISVENKTVLFIKEAIPSYSTSTITLYLVIIDGNDFPEALAHANDTLEITLSISDVYPIHPRIAIKR